MDSNTRKSSTITLWILGAVALASCTCCCVYNWDDMQKGGLGRGHAGGARHHTSRRYFPVPIFFGGGGGSHPSGGGHVGTGGSRSSPSGGFGSTGSRGGGGVGA
jgi:hypothetical protein